MRSDLTVFVFTESILLLLFVVTFIADIRIRLKDNKSGITAEITRGEQSMNALYVNFGIATVVFTLIVQAFEALKGNQVLFIVVNYGMLTYMFFFSTWFRNRLFFQLLGRIKKEKIGRN